MKNKVFVVLALSGLAMALAVPVFAQSLKIEANVPFEFVAGGKTLPAGEYSVINTPMNTLTVRNESNHEGVMVISNAVQNIYGIPSGPAKLVFHRYGNRYFLAQAWSDHNSLGRQLPMTRDERAASESATLRPVEEVVILAKL